MSDISKVVYGNKVLIDLTQDTVNANNMLLGTTAHGANGEPIVGSLITHNVIDNLTSTSTEDALSANQGRVLKEMIDSIDGGNGGSVIRVTFEEECAGDTVTFAMSGMTTITKTVPSESPYMIEVTTTELGILTVTDVTQSITKTININTYSLYTLYIALAGFEQWLEAGGITTQYASLAEVLADEKTVRKLFTKFASVDYLVNWAQVDNASATTILNNDYCAKWINLRDYALDTLYADTTCSALMDSADKYFYGEWVYDSTTETWGAKGNVPIMTSNSAPYGEAFTDVAGISPYQVFDGNDTQGPSTYWGNQSIGYKFTNPICLKQFKIVSQQSEAFYRWDTLKIQVSNDGTNYTDLGEFTNTDHSQTYINTVECENYFLYARVLFEPISQYTSIFTIQFYGRELKVSVPTMTSNTEPWGEAISSGVADGANWKIFRNTYDNSNYWQANITSNPWIGFDFGSEVCVKTYFQRSSYSAGSRPMEKAIVQGSNDKQTWEDCSEEITVNNNVAYALTIKNINPQNKSFRYWRIYQTVGTTGGTLLTQAQFYGLDYSEHEERHYIYDHGVELEEVTISGSGTKENEQIYINGDSYPSVYTQIDLTDYDIVRAEYGNKGNSNTFAISCGQSASDKNSLGKRTIQTLDLPNNMYFDCTNINTNCYQHINSEASATCSFTVKSWWLE